MLPRDGVILYQKTETDTATEIQDINIVDPISAFYLEVECTNGATSNKGNFISDIVTKVEVVDGSDVLVSLNWFQLEALYFQKTGKVPVMFPSEWGGGGQRHGVYLLFGRYLWDRAYAFNPTRYKNPQIKVTFNKAAIRAASATGFADANNIKLTIVAKIMEGLSPPGAYFMQKQIDSFTSAASGEKRIDLPTDYPYVSMLIRAYIQGSDIDEVISDLKLTCETDKYIPFDRKVKQLDAEAFALFGTGRIKHDVKCSNQEAVRLFFNKEPDVKPFFRDEGNLNIIGVAYAWSSQVALIMYTHAGVADTTDREPTMIEEGHALHATLPIFFGRPYVPEDFFNAPGFKKIEAVFTQATVSAVVQVVVEQLRS